MLKKQGLFVLLVTSLLVLTQCTKDDSNDDNGGYDFIEQVAQGKIDGKAWLLKSGYAEESYWGEGELSIKLYSSVNEDVCNSFIFKEDYVMFTVNAEVGVYPLSFDMSGSSESQTVTLYATESGVNYIVSEGAVEIVSVDTIADIVKGRIDARSGSDNFINGDFEITYCD